MTNSTVCRKERCIRLVGIVLCELFTAATIILLLVRGQYGRLPLAFGTLLMIFIPEIAERIFRCKISLPAYIFGLLYSVGPMIGQCHNFYYLVSWWDKALHIAGGVMFALFGLYLGEVFAKKGRSKLLFTALVAVCFSVTLSALWEFTEFGCDMLLGTDMQDDTVITAINSYILGTDVGSVGSLSGIGEVLVDGSPLPVQGYIDIGIIDSMMDMILETAGTLTVAIVYLADKGKHPAFIPLNVSERECKR